MSVSFAKCAHVSQRPAGTQVGLRTFKGQEFRAVWESGGGALGRAAAEAAQLGAAFLERFGGGGLAG